MSLYIYIYTWQREIFKSWWFWCEGIRIQNKVGEGERETEAISMRGAWNVCLLGAYFPAAFHATKAALRERTKTLNGPPPLHIFRATTLADAVAGKTSSNELCESSSSPSSSSSSSSDSSCQVVVPFMQKVDADAMHALKKKGLRAVVQFGVGLEGVDLDAAAKLGVSVLNMPASDSGNAEATAEHAVFLCMAAMRGVHRLRESFANRKLGEPIGYSLQKKKVMLVGYGAVGQSLAKMLKGFQCEVRASRRTWASSPPQSSSSSASMTNGDDDVLAERIDANDNAAMQKNIAQADAVFVTCVLNESTRGLVNADFLNVMRDDAFLINVARGPVIDYDALLDTLQRGRLGGVGLDVYWNEPFDPTDPIVTQFERVFATPHVGGVTDVSYRKMGYVLVDTCMALMQDKSALPPGVNLVIDGLQKPS